MYKTQMRGLCCAHTDASTATAEQLNLIAVYLSISLPVVGVAIITASLCCHVRAARLVKVTTSR